MQNRRPYLRKSGLDLENALLSNGTWIRSKGGIISISNVSTVVNSKSYGENEVDHGDEVELKSPQPEDRY